MFLLSSKLINLSSRGVMYHLSLTISLFFMMTESFQDKIIIQCSLNKY